ncbi:Hypothetical predicted protein [Pelobates cultripes]|uniref:Uncharacterized protein n=1 Tax=Pelobates cultripes TaxID=61616 RepID=A0AAD1S6H3_PELCU|nr:Hypothetical predicted protein [Pelobates cultripes]
MADTSATSMQDEQWPARQGTDAQARDSISVIFDCFWAKLQAHMLSARPNSVKPARHTVQEEGRPGKPPQGAKEHQATNPRDGGLPGLGAIGCQPHRRKGTRGNQPKTEKNTHRNIPTGKTLGHYGAQARGTRAPAPIQRWGRRAQTTHHRSRRSSGGLNLGPLRKPQGRSTQTALPSRRQTPKAGKHNQRPAGLQDHLRTSPAAPRTPTATLDDHPKQATTSSRQGIG